ncbi:MAG: PAS domain-containing sensor histidine kinase [Ginsengibacter sp.]
MFGYTEEEAIGKHISIIIPPDRIEEETLIIENIRNGNKVDHFETERISKDGTIKNISVTVSPIKNKRGIIIGASKTARDISLKIEAEKQKELFTQRLKELNVYKDEFMIMASHELKTPLTIITANLQILKLLLENEAHTVFVDKTRKQTLKLSNLIGNLFEVSNIQAGRLVLNITSFDIGALVKEVVANMQQTSKNHRIIYTYKSGIIVSADCYKLEQVVVNLLNNAIKYMPEPGEINVKVENDENIIIFQVTDHGIGIPEKDIEKIFQRFYRVSGSASSFTGSGIG